MSTPTAAESTQTETVIAEFQRKIAEFNNLYDSLRAVPDSFLTDHPDLWGERNRVLQSGLNIKRTLADVIPKVELFTQSFADNFNWESVSDYWGGLFDRVTGGDGLGLMPLAWGAIALAVGGASAAMTKWISDAYIVRSKIDAAQKLSRDGFSTTQITDILRTEYGGIKFSYLLAGAAGLLLVLRLTRQ